MTPSDLLPTPANSQTIADSTTRSLAEPKLLEALASVAADSQQFPEQYLRDTVVPHGGE